MRLLSTSVLAVSLCLMLVVPAIPAKTVSVRVPYHGGAPFGFSSPEYECGDDAVRSLGVVCLALPPDASSLTFWVQDATNLAIGGSYYLYDANGEFAGQGLHCQHRTLDVAGVALAIVRLETIGGPLACAGAGKATGEPTKGYVQFRVS